MHVAHALWVRGMSERGIVALVMQTYDNSLTVFGTRTKSGRWQLSSRQGEGEPNPTWLPVANDAARRLGNEYLFQMLAMQNIEVMNGYGVKKIVTNCPHAYNTLAHEYPDLDGDYEVVHGTQLVADLVRRGGGSKS